MNAEIEGAVPYRHPAFGEKPRRRRSGEPPLPKAGRSKGETSRAPARQPRPPAPRRTYETEIRQVLERLAEGPTLSRDLPKYSEAIALVEQRGLGFARCFERCPDESSRWLWSITDEGRQWLAR
jgi:hypothetical protein